MRRGESGWPYSERAHEWVAQYHGSIDTTALLMAYDAGFADGDQYRIAATIQQVVREDREALDILAESDRDYPTEEQINDWNIHNDHADNFEKDSE